jgi:hypothetical protein
MIAVKGRYDGTRVTLDKTPVTHECEVIITFLDSSNTVKSIDDGSLAYLFKGYMDDGIREPVVDFGEAVGNEQW